MKKLILLIVLLIFLTLTAFTSEDVFEEDSIGKWSYATEINPIDDTTMIWFALECENPTYRSPVLGLRWLDGKTDLYVIWRNYFSDGSVRVTYRLDTEKAVKKTWNGSTDNETTFYPGKSKIVIKFIRKLMETDKLAVQATPYGEGPTTAVFDIRGLKNVIKLFNDTLAWIEKGK